MPPRSSFCLATHANSRGRSGFSLVELLIVIGGIGALLAILLPTIFAVRQQARAVACLANLRQWGTATLAYATDNRGALPRRGQGQQPTTVVDRPADWFNAVPRHLGLPTFQTLVAQNRPPRFGERSLWICPEAQGDVPNYLFTYGMNMRLSTWLTPQPDRIDKLGDLTSMVLLADGPSGYCSVLPAAASYSPVARHGGHVQIAFLDGHAASFKGEDIGCGMGDPNRPDVRWVVPGSPWKGPGS